MNSSLPSGALVIFGITGDLAQRKLIPALYHLAAYNMLPDTFRIIGVTRRQITAPDVLSKLDSFVPDADPTVVAWLAERLEIFQMDLLNTNDYVRLREHLDALETDLGVCMQRLFYLAIPAQTYAPVIEQLGRSGLDASCPHGTGESRLLIEKPFGYDLTSAEELITQLTDAYDEQQIYRIDHYVAKETAQNIMTFRSHNAIFEALWNKQHVTRIVITASEKLDIEGRVAFYEQTGALRDLIQSHLLQLLALVTMEDTTGDAEQLHAHKLALLKSIEPIAPNMVATQAVRGQYDGYRTEVDNARSLTETYAALRLSINNDRWRGVPVILETGKALAEKSIQISLTFSDSATTDNDTILLMNIQPNEGVELGLRAKKPGFAHDMQPVAMEFRYKHAFGEATRQPDAYERVIADAIKGDRILFTTGEEVIASWNIIQHVLQEWAKNDEQLYVYDKGSNGPEARLKLFPAD
jgi:glucose-6-phosphate 1-dehydrogenase